MTTSDLIAQATVESFNRPWRSLLTAMGTVVGVGMLVVTFGLTASARGQVDRRFDALTSTELSVQDAHPDDGVFALDQRSVDAAAGMQYVRRAGIIGEIKDVKPSLTRSQGGVIDSADVDQGELSLQFADPAGLDVAQIHVRGRSITPLEESSGSQVALIGASAARALHLGLEDLPTVVYIGSRRFLVTGWIDAAERHKDLISSIVIPKSTAYDVFGDAAKSSTVLVVDTVKGATDQVRARLAANVSPVDPDRVVVLAQPAPAGLRSEVTGDLTTLLAILAGVGLLAGVIGIANTTLVSVMERVPEIGLRRALGARRDEIALQFLTESLLLGSFGGLLGTGVGMAAISSIALLKHWVPMIEPWILVAAPFAGTLTGLAAGAYPAARASRTDPVLALSG